MSVVSTGNGCLYDVAEGTPEDWRCPDWDNAGKCYDWKNYVPEEIQAEWSMFRLKHRGMIARMLKDAAFRVEDWD